MWKINKGVLLLHHQLLILYHPYRVKIPLCDVIEDIIVWGIDADLPTRKVAVALIWVNLSADFYNSNV